MGATKRDYMEIHDPLAERYYVLIQKIIKDEELLYETLDCDISPKDIE
tara:strand:- start:447 stop:590 length:144 start_codon:yes stop_codon:yes gene_type:complete